MSGYGLTRVLVGGKDRKTVLENHLSRLKEQPEQGFDLESLSLSWRDLEIEPTARYRGDNNRKYSFDESLASIEHWGYQRHLLPAEAFQIIINRYDQGQRPPLFEQLINPGQDLDGEDSGEWCDMALRKEGRTLYVYEHPRGLRCEDGIYVADKFDSKPPLQFDLGDTFHDIATITELSITSGALVTYLWSQPYDTLPEDFKSAGRLIITHDNEFLPLHHARYTLCANRNSTHLSRGCRVKNSGGGL